MTSRKKSKDTLRQMKMNTQQPNRKAKAVLRGKFIAIPAMNSLMLHLKEVHKEQQTQAR